MCERLLTDVDRWQCAHDSDLESLTTMRRNMLCPPFVFVRLLVGYLIDAFSLGRKNTAEKRSEAVDKELSVLRAALESKEKDLVAQRGELERLRRVEERFLQVEGVECERLRVLASSLAGKEDVPFPFFWCVFFSWVTESS